MLTLGFVLSLHGADEKVTVTGSGRNRDDAIRSALNSAVEQKYGMNLSSVSQGKTTSLETLTSVNGQETDMRHSSDSLARNIKTISKGRITGYTIMSEERNPATGEYNVILEVAFPAKYVVGDDPDALRRMVVSHFRVNADEVSVFGAPVNAAAWEHALSDAINIYMTQTRKFTMLDRDFDSESNEELARLNDPNAAPRDAIRLCQKLATDYLVVGTITFTNVQPPTENPYTGKMILPSQTVFATVSYRVILAATGQLKWTNSVQIDARNFYSSLAGGAVHDSAAYAAQLVGDGIVSCILPYEIVGFNPDGTVIIGEGGKTFEIGEFLSVYNLGQEVTDTRTGKVIDGAEMRVGMLQIVQKTEKLSYAVVVSGSRDQMKKGSRLRRDDFSRAAAAQVDSSNAQPPQSGVVRTTGAGGVVVPF